MSFYDLKGLFGVPGWSYRILMTSKRIWRILGVGSFFQGPRVSFEVLEGWEVLGGSGGVPKKLMGVKVFKVSWSATL